MEIKSNCSLLAYNGFAFDVSAEKFIRLTSRHDLGLFVEKLLPLTVPFLFLGEGSNTVLMSDVSGLVIQCAVPGIRVIKESADDVLLEVGAGENWDGFVQYCLRQCWYGLENLSLIPGLVGASPVQNIGAYGVEMSDCCVAVEYLDLQSGVVNLLPFKQCHFDYRSSIFKERPNWLITAVQFKLSKKPSLKIDYPGIRDAMEKNYQQPWHPKQVANTIINLRQQKLPNPSQIPNTGSFFKNPIVGDREYKNIKNRYADVVAFAHDAGWKLSAAWLIDQCGLKGRRNGGVSVYYKHALVLVNDQQGMPSDLMGLIELIQNEVELRFSIFLEPEPRIVGV